jgi:signal transduction histidine kinase
MPPLDGRRGQLAQNTRIAAALLDVLGESGEIARRLRALRALGVEAVALHARGRWLPFQNLADMLSAADLNRREARRVGQSLVRPEGVGIALCYSGLATPEKVFRRADQLFARESEDSRYESREIGGQRGCIVFDPGPREQRPKLDAGVSRALCAMRAGMFEAVPMLFGLVAAQVRERECAYDGAERCVFEVSWTRTPRSGMNAGAGLGLLLGGGLAATLYLAALPIWAAIVAGLCGTVLAAAAGRAIDLARQLEAVAGARRGQLALLDQLDGSIAEKMDELAKLDAPRESVTRSWSEGEVHGLVPVASKARAGALVDDDYATAEASEAVLVVGRTASSIRTVSTELRTSLAGLAKALDGQGFDLSTDEPGGVYALMQECTGQGREVEERAAELERVIFAGEQVREVCSPAQIVERAVLGMRAELPSSLAVDVDLAHDVPDIDCDAFQIEYVVEQLLRNAAGASSDGGIIRIVLSETPTGVEIAVQDDGEGVDPALVEEAFDPFEGGAPTGQQGHLGLAICYRIVADHDGELRVQSDEEDGTRVSVLLPAQPAVGAS